jgi:hypothetical protein
VEISTVGKWKTKYWMCLNEWALLRYIVWRKWGLEINSARMKVPWFCKGIGRKENPLTPLLMFIVFI